MRSSIRRRRLSITVAVTAALALALSACSGQAKSPSGGSGDLDLSDVTITFGIQGQPDTYEASGAWDGTDYKVEFAPFSLPGDNFAANTAGDVDLSDLPVWTGIQALAALPAGTDLPYQSAIFLTPPYPDESDPTGYLIASKASGIKTLDDIKNHKGAKLKFGYTKKSAQEIYAARALDYLGMSFDDVESVDLQYANLLVALDTGDIDVLFLPQSVAVKQIDNGAVPVAPISEFGYTSRWSLWVNSADIKDKKKKAAVADAISRYVDYYAWVIDHPKKFQDIFVTKSGYAPRAATLQWEYSRWLPVPVDKEQIDLAQDELDFAVKFGVVAKSVDVKPFFTDEFNDTVSTAIKDSDYVKKLNKAYGK